MRGQAWWYDRCLRSLREMLLVANVNIYIQHGAASGGAGDHDDGGRGGRTDGRRRATAATTVWLMIQWGQCLRLLSPSPCAWWFSLGVHPTEKYVCCSMYGIQLFWYVQTTAQLLWNVTQQQMWDGSVYDACCNYCGMWGQSRESDTTAIRIPINSVALN